MLATFVLSSDREKTYLYGIWCYNPAIILNVSVSEQSTIIAGSYLLMPGWAVKKKLKKKVNSHLILTTADIIVPLYPFSMTKG